MRDTGGGPFPGLSPLGFRPGYYCLPHSPNEVLGLVLLTTNFKPTLTSPYAGSQNNLQPIVQRRKNANKGLTIDNAMQPMQETQWCTRRATSCNALGTLALNHTILHSGTNDHTYWKAQEMQNAAQKSLQWLPTLPHS